MADVDGGAAFPQSNCVTCRAEYQDAPPPSGMSLRDYFAAHAARAAADAVCGLLEENKTREARIEAERHAVASYMVADAMLKAREAKA